MVKIGRVLTIHKSIKFKVVTNTKNEDPKFFAQILRNGSASVMMSILKSLHISDIILHIKKNEDKCFLINTPRSKSLIIRFILSLRYLKQSHSNYLLSGGKRNNFYICLLLNLILVLNSYDVI